MIGVSDGLPGETRLASPENQVAHKRGGYQRKLTPLLDEFAPPEAVESAPPPELRTHRPTRKEHDLERLLEWRDHAARAGGVLPEAICSERALKLIAEHRPHTPEELDALTGLGPLTSRRLHAGIEAALAGA